MRRRAAPERRRRTRDYACRAVPAGVALAPLFLAATWGGGGVPATGPALPSESNQAIRSSQLIEPNQRLALETALGLPATLDFDLSRDGRRAVLAVAAGDRSTLFLAAAGARPGALTSGHRWDSAPRFLAGGLEVVFVSGARPAGAEPEAGRLFRLSLGGEPVPLTGADLRIRSPAVAPSGDRIAFLGERPAAVPEEADTGYDLWVIGAEGGEPRRLTRHPGDEGPPAWSPDGLRLAYAFSSGQGRGLAVVAAGETDAGADLPAPLVLTSDRDGAVRGVPGWTPDGAGLAWSAVPACVPECPSGGFHAIRFAGSAGESQPYRLVARDRDLAEPRFRPGSGPGDALELAWIEADRASRRIHRSRLELAADGRWKPTGRVRVVTRGAGVARGLRWTEDGSALAALHEAAAFPRDVWSFPLTGGRQRISDTLFPEIDVRSFSRPERIEAASGDGLTVGALLYRPTAEEGEEPERDAPLLVHLRGMAGAAWQNGFDPIMQLLAERGYAVLAPNVRGTGGRGAVFAAANDGDWGGGDLRDLVALTRAAQALPGVSPDDACVFGVGYGGFLALAALAREPDLFDCGVEAMGTADFLRLHRVLDPKRRAELEAELGPLRGNLERYRRLSLTGEGAAIRVPLLSFHGEEVPEAPLEAKADFLAELWARAAFPLVELYFRGDTGRSVFRWETDRGATYAFLEKVLEFLSIHLPAG